MAMPQIDDTFVRRFTKTAIHARRFKIFYAVGAAWLAVLTLVPSVRTAVIPGAAGQRPGVISAAQQAMPASSPANGTFSGAPNATSGSDAVTDLMSPEDAFGIVSDTVADADVPAADVPSAGGTTAGAPPVLPPPPYIPIPAVPEPLKPALLAASPIVGGVCDTVGTVALIATVGSAAAPPEVPVKEVFPYITPVYIACGSIPRLETKGECSIDATLPNPIADQGLPVSANIGQLVFDQLRAIEVLLASVGAPNPGFSAMAGDPLGCVVPS